MKSRLISGSFLCLILLHKGLSGAGDSGYGPGVAGAGAVVVRSVQ